MPLDNWQGSKLYRNKWARLYLETSKLNGFYTLCILSWKECERMPNQCQKLHRLQLPTPLSLPPVALPKSVGLCPRLTICPVQAPHTDLFIARTYFTTFPALEREEDQTSSVVNFPQEHSLRSMARRKPYSHTRTEVGGWGGKGEERASYITRKNWRLSFQQVVLTV